MPTSFTWNVVLPSAANIEAGASLEPVSGEELPRDIKLDLATGLLDKSTGGLQMTRGPEAVGQSLLLRLRTFKREWFLDRNAGIDYLGRVFVKAPSPEVIRSDIRDETQGTVGVGAVPTVNMEVDVATRHLSVEVGAETDYGEILATLNVTPP